MHCQTFEDLRGRLEARSQRTAFRAFLHRDSPVSSYDEHISNRFQPESQTVRLTCIKYAENGTERIRQGLLFLVCLSGSSIVAATAIDVVRRGSLPPARFSGSMTGVLHKEKMPNQSGWRIERGRIKWMGSRQR